MVAVQKSQDERLSERLKRGRISIAETTKIMRQLVAAVERAHRAGCLVTDLTSAGIRLARDERGETLARIDPSVITPARGHEDHTEMQTLAHGSFTEKARYMSPEECAGGEIDERSDVYKLGVILYEMIAGHVPFDGESAAVIARQHVERAAPLHEFSDPTLQPIASVLSRALEKSPAVRLPLGEFARYMRSIEYLSAGAASPAVNSAPQLRVVPASTNANAVADGSATENAKPQREAAVKDARPQREALRDANPSTSTENHLPTRETDVVAAAANAAAVAAASSSAAVVGDETVLSEAPLRSSLDDDTTASNPVLVTDAAPAAPESKDEFALPQITVPIAGEAKRNRRSSRAYGVPLALCAAAILCAVLFVNLKSNNGEAAYNTAVSPATPAGTVSVGGAPENELAANSNSASQSANASGAQAGLTTNAQRAEFGGAQVPMVFSRPRAYSRTSAAANKPLEQALANEFDRWLAALNAGDLSALMSFYAQKLDFYYDSRGVSRRSVRAQKTRITNGDVGRGFRVSDPEITFSPDNRSATMRFTASYPASDRRGGKQEVVQELLWAKQNGGWKIVGERDLGSAG